MKMLKYLWSLAVLPSVLLAQVTFTFTGTATSTAGPYTSGQAVTLIFVLNDFSPTAPSGFAGSRFNQWQEQTLTNPEIFDSVSGTGLVGTWTRPSASNTSPQSEIVAYDALHPSSANRLSLTASRDSGTTGLTVGGNAFYTLTVEGVFTGLVFAAGSTYGSLPDPTDYFSNYVGTYAAAQSTVTFADATFQTYNLNITSLQIAVATVPEPSAAAAGLALAALAVIALQRYRKRRAVALSRGPSPGGLA